MRWLKKGESLTGEKFSQIYLDILKKYYGHDKGVMNIDDLYAIEWAYIPHFYYNFYVFPIQYILYCIHHACRKNA
jgi:oligoendopeptidase F